MTFLFWTLQSLLLVGEFVAACIAGSIPGVHGNFYYSGIIVAAIAEALMFIAYFIFKSDRLTRKFLALTLAGAVIGGVVTTFIAAFAIGESAGSGFIILTWLFNSTVIALPISSVVVAIADEVSHNKLTES